MNASLMKAFFLLSLSVLFIASSKDLMAQHRLFEHLFDGERLLNPVQLEKYHRFRQQRSTQHITLAHIGDLHPGLHRRTLLVNIPGHSEAFIARSTRVRYYSADDYIWNGKLLAANGSISLVNRDGGITGAIRIADQ